MKIYIASHNQRSARRLASVLARAGHEVTARWIGARFGPTGSFGMAERHRIAATNYADVTQADALVLMSGPEKYSGGKFMEAGYAYGLGKCVLILGRRENLQCYGTKMQRVTTRGELLTALSALPNVPGERPRKAGTPDEQSK